MRHVKDYPATMQALQFDASTTINAVYMIASLHHPAWYIGQTGNFTTRTRQHFLSSVKAIGKVDSAPTQRVHRYMMDIGINEFFIFPLVLLPASAVESDRLHVEKLFIRLLQPQLNVRGSDVRKPLHQQSMRRNKKSRPKPNKRRRLNTMRENEVGVSTTFADVRVELSDMVTKVAVDVEVEASSSLKTLPSLVNTSMRENEFGGSTTFVTDTRKRENVDTSHPALRNNCAVDVQEDNEEPVARPVSKDMRYPEEVMKCNDKLEGLISDEFKAVVIHGIRELGLKYPNKLNTLMATLSNTPRDEIGESYVKRAPLLSTKICCESKTPNADSLTKVLGCKPRDVIGESYVNCAPLLSTKICCESKAPNAVSLTKVLGSTRIARFWQHENNITNAAQRAAHFRLTSAVYLRARLNTAARHMMMATLGCAVPKNIGAAITARIVEANKEAPMWEPHVTPGPLPLQMRQSEPSVCDTALNGITTFRVKTPYAMKDTQSLMPTLWDLVSQAPLSEQVGQFVVTSVQIAILHRGTLRARIPACTQKKLWCPLAYVLPTVSPTTLHRTTLRRAVHGLQTGALGVVYVPAISIGIAVDPRLVVLYYDMGRNPQNTQWLLRGLPIEAVLFMFDSHKIIQSPPWREIVKSNLMHHLNLTWGISPLRRLILKLPATLPDRTLQMMKKFLSTVLLELTIQPVSLQTRMMKNKSVVITKGESIAKIARNAIHMAKSLRRFEPPTCTCAKLRLLFDSVPSTNHLCVRANAAIHAWIRDVLGCNANTTVFIQEKPESILKQSLCSTFTAIKSWLGRKHIVTPLTISSIATSIAVGSSILSEWHQDSVGEIVEAAALIGLLPTANLWGKTAEASRTLTLAQQNATTKGTTKAQVKECCVALEDSVISPLDRNGGQLCVMCPAGYHHAFFKLFEVTTNQKRVRFNTQATVSQETSKKSCLRMENTPTYKHLPALAAEVVLVGWAKRYSSFSHLARMRKGSVPYAYVQPKHKDATRFRPIISYSATPQRSLLRIVARALFFVLQSIDCDHYNLWSAYNARAGLIAAHKDLCSAQDLNQYANYRVMAVSLDVKDMYSVLPHAEVREAVAWACTLFKAQLRRDRCNIQLHGKAEGKKGRTYDTTTRREVTLEDIVSATDIGLQECFFTAGDSMMLQTTGIPMGAPTSPALAIAVCIRAEHLFIASIRDVQRPLAGVRYFDDLLLWTVVKTSCDGIASPVEHAAASALLDTNKRIYHPALRLLDQKDGPSTFNFLETKITFTDDMKLETAYYNKNAETLAAPQPYQDIQRFRHGSSASPQRSLQSVVACMLNRASKMETNGISWMYSILLLIREFLFLNYPVGWITKTLHRLSKRHHLGMAWKIIADIVTDTSDF